MHWDRSVNRTLDRCFEEILCPSVCVPSIDLAIDVRSNTRLVTPVLVSNNGSCVLGSQSYLVICICTKECLGAQCQWKRLSILLSLSIGAPYRGAVIQLFEIDLISLDLSLVDQQVFRTLPQLIEYFHDEQTTTIPNIVLAKVYPSD